MLFRSEGFKRDEEANLKPGQQVQVGQFTVRMDELKLTDDGQKQMVTAYMSVLRDGKPDGRVFPAKWYFRKHESQPTTEVAIRRGFFEDLYVVMPAFDVPTQSASVAVHVNPLVNWIWVGFGLLAMITGALFSVWISRSIAGPTEAASRLTQAISDGDLTHPALAGVKAWFDRHVPRELRRMLEEQIIPRLLARAGQQTAVFLKRFHSYGIGESHADSLLAGVAELVPDGTVKLGFRAHYPQLETKLTVRGRDMEDVRQKLAPVEHEVRKRLGNFILAEDDQTLEGVVLEELTRKHATLTVVEMFTGGQIAGRLAHLPGAEQVFRRGIVARHLADACAAVGLDQGSFSGGVTRETAEAVARAAQRHGDRKSTRLNSSHMSESRMPSSA